MKYFVFGDVHGFYSILKNELKEKGFDENNENHILISLGDNFDRGSENIEMYQFLKEMKGKNKIILIKGNHEDLLLDVFKRGAATQIDVNNGTYGTLNQFYNYYFKLYDSKLTDNDLHDLYSKMKNDGFIDFINDMQDYYETKNYVYTHGFIPIDGIINYYYNSNCSYNPDWRNSTSQKFKEARWINGIEMSIKYNINVPNKKVVIGHFHSSYGNVRKDMPKGLSDSIYKKYEFSNLDYFLPYEDDNIIALDACTVYTNKINILVIEEID